MKNFSMSEMREHQPDFVIISEEQLSKIGAEEGDYEWGRPKSSMFGLLELRKLLSKQGGLTEEDLRNHGVYKKGEAPARPKTLLGQMATGELREKIREEQLKKKSKPTE